MTLVSAGIPPTLASPRKQGGLSLLKRLVPSALKPKWRRTYSQEGEDIVLVMLFGDEYRGTYVDIGAFDPFWYSNTRKLYERGWRGLNIDPRPGVAAAFARHRPRDVTIEAAIPVGDAPMRYWFFPEPRNNCLAPEEPSLQKGEERIRPYASVEVPMVSIEEALARAGLERVDLLNLDIEGGEERILRQWPWKRARPRAICVEIIGLSAGEVAETPLRRFLQAKGYAFASQLFCSVIFVDELFLRSRYPHAPSVQESRAS